MKKTLFFTHIPKCGGNGMIHIFTKLGYKCNKLCNVYHGHKNNDKKNFILLSSDFSNNNDSFCKNAIQNIQNNNNVINLLVHHVFPRKKNKHDFIIASIRNPYDLIVSRFHYHNKFYPNQYNFEQWVKNFAGETLMRFTEQCYENGNNSKDMIIDYFIRLEYIETDINKLLSLNILQTTLDEKQLHILYSMKKNSTSHKHFSNYYTQELKDIVYESSKIIFDMFQYEK